MIEKGLKLRTKLESCSTLKAFVAPEAIVPKIADTGIAFGIGDDVFFDAAEGKVTNLLTANTLCGRALEAADEDAVEVLVHLMVLTTPAGT